MQNCVARTVSSNLVITEIKPSQPLQNPVYEVAMKRATKTTKVELLENMLLEARESGKQSALKRSRANAAVVSSDDDPASVFDKIRHTAGAPKSVKAARREMKVKTLADLLLSDDDCLSEYDAGQHTSAVIVAAAAVGMLLDMIQEVVMEFKAKLITGMMLAPMLHMNDAIIQKISDQLPLRRWSAIISAVCNWTKQAYWKGRPAQMLLSMQRTTSWAEGNFNELEIAEHH